MHSDSNDSYAAREKVELQDRCKVRGLVDVARFLLRPAHHNEGASEQAARLHGHRGVHLLQGELAAGGTAGRVRRSSQAR